MARNQNTFAKLQRETAKKAKARDKQARRKQRKLRTAPDTRPEPQDAESMAEDEAK